MLLALVSLLNYQTVESIVKAVTLLSNSICYLQMLSLKSAIIKYAQKVEERELIHKKLSIM